jgi:hypothetical protein
MSLVVLVDQISLLFYWHRISEAFAPTIPGGAYRFMFDAFSFGHYTYTHAKP